jgi:hypothetical protein
MDWAFESPKANRFDDPRKLKVEECFGHSAILEKRNGDPGQFSSGPGARFQNPPCSAKRINPVIPVWRQARPHIGKMTWHELQTRVAQGVRKRLDVVKYRAGLSPRLNSWSNQASDGGTFFFLPEQLPGMTALLREHMGGQVEKIITEADQICRHRFRLLGYDDLDYGAEIDWHLDAVAKGRRSNPGLRSLS